MGFGWKLGLGFALTFVIGALCGVALTIGYQSSQPKKRFNARWDQVLMNNLSRELQLSAEQRNAIQPKIQAAIAKIIASRKSCVLESDKGLDEELGNLAPLLDDKQKLRLEAFRLQRRERVLREIIRNGG
ncbi:MAG: hypothetical protein JO331_02790 [Verrucomicrobia bacterium]|nr:hypothetical protein [Verrucomicrobiota bacterium]